ncbi:mitoguardin [Scaptodrosophila lebanonensis]|uniref:Mitoguardin n=1 Tax=Drosophila lebanonensis TaxID=7225 RepID=A0A6J2TR74_DROLE|nr:mitoguardin [Scaptodrosophila lebanonensis]XP_030378544.1 mitoguardin [Scaptodrosophila lebanonensis]
MQRLLPASWSSGSIMPFRVSTTTKVVLFSLTAGVALMSVLSRFLRRRKPPRPPRRPRKYTGRRTRNSMRSPNDLISIAGSKASARSGSPVGSTLAYSDRLSMASGSIGAGTLVSNAQGHTGAGDVVTQLTAQQLGVMGMEALDTVINFWEDALAAHYSPGGVPAALTTAEDSEFCREIQNLLEMSYTLQEQSELLFLDQRSVLFREEHSIDEAEEDGLAANDDGSNADEDRHSRKSGSVLSRAGSDPNFDSAESFASALDQVADLREFEGFIEASYEEYPLFQTALKHHDECTVPCRTIRSELMHCGSDTEYLAKLHCVRLAFQYLFKDPAVGQWICDAGRQILTDLLCLGDKDTKEFLVGYEDMINYLHDPSNWPLIQVELEARNVKAMTFYDICLDFIILDSFRDLDAPPASVTAVVQNRWLSNGFKETALTTAVWSVLKAKKRMLKFPNGFMAHFYVISEQISPLMAWGFFGPNENLRDICHYFREQLLSFLADIFSFQKSRFTTIEEFSQDVLQHMKTRVNNIGIKFSQ